jgi:hypothetical protein
LLARPAPGSPEIQVDDATAKSGQIERRRGVRRHHEKETNTGENASHFKARAATSIMHPLCTAKALGVKLARKPFDHERRVRRARIVGRSRRGLWHNRNDKCRWSRFIVVDHVCRLNHARSVRLFLARVHISIETREIAARYLEAKFVARAEHIARCY